MPLINKKFNQNPDQERSARRDPLLSVRHSEIIHREDIKTSFGYVLVGLTVSFALAGTIYVVGKQLIK